MSLGVCWISTPAPALNFAADYASHEICQIVALSAHFEPETVQATTGVLTFKVVTRRGQWASPRICGGCDIEFREIRASKCNA